MTDPDLRAMVDAANNAATRIERVAATTELLQAIPSLLDEIEALRALLARSAALHRAMVLDLPGLLADAGLSDEEHLCNEADALADEIEARLALQTPEEK